uniref:Coiled-coil domain-containing protein 69 n=1 Tax=Anas platyrhynchos TaxID=8839 RepID=A0A8B9SLU1_ANAPL
MGCTGSALRCCPKRQLKAQQGPASQELTALKSENASAGPRHGAGQEKAALRDGQGTEAAQLLQGREEEEEERLRGVPGTEAEGPRGVGTQVEKGKAVELKEQLSERFEALRREHEETLQELRRAHEQEKLLLEETHHRSQEALQETVEALRAQLKSFQERMKRVEESLLSRDYKKHIEEHGSPSPFWEQELESLHFVIRDEERAHPRPGQEAAEPGDRGGEEPAAGGEAENPAAGERGPAGAHAEPPGDDEAALGGAAGRPRGAGEGGAAAGAGSPREGGAAVPSAQRGGRLPLPHRRRRRAPHRHVAPRMGWPGSPLGLEPGDAVTSACAPGAGPRGGRVPAVSPCTGRWSASWDAPTCLSSACALPVLRGGPAPCRASSLSSGVRPWSFLGTKGATQGTRTYTGLDPTPALGSEHTQHRCWRWGRHRGCRAQGTQSCPHPRGRAPTSPSSPRCPLQLHPTAPGGGSHGSGTSPLTATPKPSPPHPPPWGKTPLWGRRHAGGTRAGCTRALSPGKRGPSRGAA